MRCSALRTPTRLRKLHRSTCPNTEFRRNNLCFEQIGAMWGSVRRPADSGGTVARARQVVAALLHHTPAPRWWQGESISPRRSRRRLATSRSRRRSLLLVVDACPGLSGSRVRRLGFVPRAVAARSGECEQTINRGKHREHETSDYCNGVPYSGGPGPLIFWRELSGSRHQTCKPARWYTRRRSCHPESVEFPDRRVHSRRG